MNLKSALNLLLTSTFAVAALSAAPLSYTLSGGNNSLLADGASKTYTSGGVTLTITGWSLATSGSSFATGSLGLWSPGVGVCNDAERANCTSNSHTVDNFSGYDFVLFQFSAPVQGASISLATFGDTDASYWTSSTNFTASSLAGKTTNTLSSLGFGGMTTNSGGNVNRTVNISGTGITSILFGSALPTPDGTYDYFKISGVAGETCPPPGQVPEPSTFALLGGSLVGLSVAIRRRQRA